MNFENLNTKSQIDNPDEFYNKLIAMHDGLTEEQSLKLNAKLIFILCNHIGDARVLDEALAMAKNA